MATNERRVFLGDAVYAAFDGYAIILTTEDGIRVTNTIVLEPDVYAALRRWVERTLRKGESNGPTNE